MSLSLRVRPEAEADMAEAYTWYAQRGLGEELIAAIEDRLRQIQAQPKMYPVIHRDVRRARIRRFRYAIFYVLEPDTITVLAVLHEARNPGRWQDRT
jgi:toxin ParE1/3/4